MNSWRADNVASGRKSLFRLAILILVLPVCIVLFLHFFGTNKMQIPVVQSLSECDLRAETKIGLTGQVTSNEEKNQISRILKRIVPKNLELDTLSGGCFSDTTALLLIDSKNNLRGAYDLSHGEISRFFIELDILLPIEYYGKGVSR